MQGLRFGPQVGQMGFEQSYAFWGSRDLRVRGGKRLFLHEL